MNPENVTPNAAEILARTGCTAEKVLALARKRFRKSKKHRRFGQVDFEIGGHRLALIMGAKRDGSDARILAEVDMLRQFIALSDAIAAGAKKLGIPVYEDVEAEAKRAYLRMMEEDEAPEPPAH